eukprot:5925750-Prymnesium_polylepis.1
MATIDADKSADESAIHPRCAADTVRIHHAFFMQVMTCARSLVHVKSYTQQGAPLQYRKRRSSSCANIWRRPATFSGAWRAG